MIERGGGVDPLLQHPGQLGEGAQSTLTVPRHFPTTTPGVCRSLCICKAGSLILYGPVTSHSRLDVWKLRLLTDTGKERHVSSQTAAFWWRLFLGLGLYSTL